jgi:ceramide glucosyltransferase
VATKVQKLLAALPHARGEILMFVDDDILLRPDAAAGLARYLQAERTGAAFGLAVYTNWSNIPSSLLSVFVNGNALLSYLPLTYLAEPFTITGHFYALRREVFDALGGLDNMRGRFDDDHELARRVARLGLANVQTPVMYDVDNYLRTIDDYANQMHRWFVIPRQTMAPSLTGYQQFVSLVGSAGGLLPPLLAAVTVLRVVQPRQPQAGRATLLAPLLWVLALHAAVYAFCARTYLHRQTPWRRTPLILLSAVIAPLQALGGLLGSPSFRWRGQHIRLRRGGTYDLLPGREKAAQK